MYICMYVYAYKQPCTSVSPEAMATASEAATEATAAVVLGKQLVAVAITKNAQFDFARRSILI